MFKGIPSPKIHIFKAKSARDFILGVYDTQYQKTRKTQKKCLICIFNWPPSWIFGVGLQNSKGTQLNQLLTSVFFNEVEK